MRLKISHTTSYHYDTPVPYALQQLRLRPKSRANQVVENWDITIEGGRKQLTFEDEHSNTVDLISFDPGASEITVHCQGEVDVTDTHGIVGRQTGFVPLWLYQRSTSLTRPGTQVRVMAAALEQTGNALNDLHRLSSDILEKVPYSTDQADPELSAEQVLTEGHGVCQDHAHVFIAVARHLGYPARYVSGYLSMDGQIDQNASHAWAEAHLPDLGWVGFDVSNGISPDDRYVRVATGLDYSGAAPVSGLRLGSAGEKLHVKLQVEQQ
ncbi:transglutaminase family protein [Seohaeicola saemankumensis]|nr:transglutaminase family protein [Seohaeicola saemankumensis]MCA0870728.1 transglutaminase family protein [Seohaeicola saemankumensis]